MEEPGYQERMTRLVVAGVRKHFDQVAGGWGRLSNLELLGESLTAPAQVYYSRYRRRGQTIDDRMAIGVSKSLRNFDVIGEAVINMEPGRSITLNIKVDLYWYHKLIGEHVMLDKRATSAGLYQSILEVLREKGADITASSSKASSLEDRLDSAIKAIERLRKEKGAALEKDELTTDSEFLKAKAAEIDLHMSMERDRLLAEISTTRPKTEGSSHSALSSGQSKIAEALKRHSRTDR